MKQSQGKEYTTDFPIQTAEPPPQRCYKRATEERQITQTEVNLKINSQKKEQTAQNTKHTKHTTTTHNNNKNHTKNKKATQKQNKVK